MLTLKDEQTSRGDGGSSPFVNSLRKILYAPRAATGYDWHPDRVGDGFDQLDIVANHHTIPIDGVDNEFPSPILFHALSKHHGIAFCSTPATMRENLIPAEEASLHVQADYDTLATKQGGRLSDEFWMFHGIGVNDDLLHTEGDHLTRIL